MCLNDGTDCIRYSQSGELEFVSHDFDLGSKIRSANLQLRNACLGFFKVLFGKIRMASTTFHFLPITSYRLLTNERAQMVEIPKLEIGCFVCLLAVERRLAVAAILFFIINILYENVNSRLKCYCLIASGLQSLNDILVL